MSSEEDTRLVPHLLNPEYEFLKLLSDNLFNSDERIKLNIIWCFSNITAEKDPAYCLEILKKTDILDFFGELVN